MSHHPAFSFLDLARRRDLASLVTVTRTAPRRPEASDHLVAASIQVWDPRQSPTREVDFAEVRAALAALPRRFPGLEIVLVDEGAEAAAILPWARNQPALALRVRGFTATVEENMKLWSELAARLYARTLSIPRHERLIAELRGLRRESFAFGSKWRVVDSSRKLHRDVSLALAGACYAAGGASGAVGPVEIDLDIVGLDGGSRRYAVPSDESPEIVELSEDDFAPIEEAEDR